MSMHHAAMDHLTSDFDHLWTTRTPAAPRSAVLEVLSNSGHFEILETILEHVSWRDLISVGATSRNLSAAVTSSAALQLTLRVAYYGLPESYLRFEGRGPRSTALARLEHLIEVQENWSSLNPTDITFGQLTKDDVLTDGLVVRIDRFRNEPTFSWTVYDARTPLGGPPRWTHEAPPGLARPDAIVPFREDNIVAVLWATHRTVRGKPVLSLDVKFFLLEPKAEHWWADGTDGLAVEHPTAQPMSVNVDCVRSVGTGLEVGPGGFVTVWFDPMAPDFKSRERGSVVWYWRVGNLAWAMMPHRNHLTTTTKAARVYAVKGDWCVVGGETFPFTMEDMMLQRGALQDLYLVRSALEGNVRLTDWSHARAARRRRLDLVPPTCGPPEDAKLHIRGVGPRLLAYTMTWPKSYAHQAGVDRGGASAIWRPSAIPDVHATVRLDNWPTSSLLDTVSVYTLPPAFTSSTSVYGLRTVTVGKDHKSNNDHTYTLTVTNHCVQPHPTHPWPLGGLAAGTQQDRTARPTQPQTAPPLRGGDNISLSYPWYSADGKSISCQILLATKDNFAADASSLPPRRADARKRFGGDGAVHVSAEMLVLSTNFGIAAITF